MQEHVQISLIKKHDMQTHLHSQFIFGVLSEILGSEETLLTEDAGTGVLHRHRFGVLVVIEHLCGAAVHQSFLLLF